jgi:hypothetical protein
MLVGVVNPVINIYCGIEILGGGPDVFVIKHRMQSGGLRLPMV